MTKAEMIEIIYKNISRKEENCWYDWNQWPFVVEFPVMIWDVLDYILWYWNLLISENKDRILKLMDIWKNKKLSIDEQNEECIIYIYNLIKNND